MGLGYDGVGFGVEEGVEPAPGQLVLYDGVAGVEVPGFVHIQSDGV